MKFRRLILLAIASLGTATSLPPFFLECSLLDRVGDAARPGLPTQPTALETLERVAEGRMDSASPDLEVQVGLKAGQLRGQGFRDPTVRAHAFRVIGKLDSPDALSYLENVRKTDIAADEPGQIWIAVQVALHEARLIRVPDADGQIKLLEDTMKTSIAASWAMTELCNRGSEQSLPAVRAYVHKYNPTPRGEEEIAFCEARMNVISRSPDRVRALASLLKASNGPQEYELIAWAISQLQAMKSQSADAELSRYLDEICNLPSKASLKPEWVSIRMHLGDAPECRQR